MGNLHFAPALNFQISYFAMDFKMSVFGDDMVIFYNVDEVVPIITNSMRRVLPVNGVTCEERVSENVVKLRLSSGVIGESSNSYMFVLSHSLLCSCFEELLRYGWCLKASTNIRRTDKRCTLFFHKDPSVRARPSKGPVLAVCLKGGNKLCLVNANPGAKEVVKTQIGKDWSKGIEVTKDYDVAACKFRLGGDPWLVHRFCDGLKESRLLILNTMNSLGQIGFEFYASSHPGGLLSAVDTIYFTRRQKVQPIDDSFIFGLLKSNEIYLVRASAAVTDIVRTCICTDWASGIESERAAPQLCTFKLNGDPWFTDGDRRRQARLLIVRVFERLRSHGWRVHSTLDLCATVDDVSCFVMESCPPAVNRFMAISLHGEESLRFLSAPEEVEAMLMNELPREWAGSVKVGRDSEGIVEMTLPSSFDRCVGVFCLMLDRLETRGWDLVSSADLSAKFLKNRPNDLHTLILEHSGPPPPKPTVSPSPSAEGYAMKM